MLIVEGPDGSGKSTLVEKLEQRLGVKKEARVVSSEAESLVDLSAWVEEHLDMPFSRRLYDRFALISAPKYTCLPEPTFQGAFREDWWYQLHWQRLISRGPLVIVCLPPFKEVQHNVMADPNNAVVQEHIEQIWLSYFDFLWGPAGSIMELVHYDYTNPDSDTKLERFIRYYEEKTRD